MIINWDQVRSIELNWALQKQSIALLWSLLLFQEPSWMIVYWVYWDHSPILSIRNCQKPTTKICVPSGWKSRFGMFWRPQCHRLTASPPWQACSGIFARLLRDGRNGSNLEKKIAGPMLTLSDYGIWNFCFLVVFRDLEKLHSCCWPATRTTGSQSHVLCIKTPWKTALLPSSGSTAMSPTIFELYLTIAQYIQFQIGFTS